MLGFITFGTTHNLQDGSTMAAIGGGITAVYSVGHLKPSEAVADGTESECYVSCHRLWPLKLHRRQI